jgi:hypothetical protein
MMIVVGKQSLLVLLISILSFSCGQKNETKTDLTQSPTEKKAVESFVIQPQTDRDTLKGSLKALATGKIGNLSVTVNYYSPAVRGRVIWGGLVPFEQVWVTGAHRATSIAFDSAVKIGGKEIPAGKYAFFTIPSKADWTIIINKNWNQHLADNYNVKDDFVRLMVKPEIKEAHQERLRYVIESEGKNAGEIVVYWEKLEVSLPISVQ